MNRLKRQAARAITNNYDWEIRGDNIMSELNIQSFEHQRDSNMAALTYKIINNLSPSYLSAKLADHPYNTRGNNTTNLLIPKFKHEFAKQSLAYNSQKIWNSLHHTTKESISLAGFKKAYRNER